MNVGRITENNNTVNTLEKPIAELEGLKKGN